FFTTGTSLVQAATTLYRLSNDERPLVWSKRLIERFVATRHTNTGIATAIYNNPRSSPLAKDLKEHFEDPHTRFFPYVPFEEARGKYYPDDVEAHDWVSLFLVGEMLGENGQQFIQWALEELTAWGKAGYRKNDNSFIPMLTDGTKLEDYVSKFNEGFASKGAVAKPLFANLGFFWAYAVAYRVTGDEFMWDMARSIGLGNSFGDIGARPTDTPQLQTHTDCSEVHGLLGLLDLYKRTKKPAFLEMARRIGDNIIEQRFHKGFFVPSKKHIYTKFDYYEPLALLHLAVTETKTNFIPRVWPSYPLFVPAYRYRNQGIDRLVIYGLTDTTELPMSLNEAVTSGDIKLVQSLLDDGVEVNEEGPEGTALYRAAEKGYIKIVELLIAKGANVNAKKTKSPVGDTPLHSAARAGHKETILLLIAKGADVNVKNEAGQTPLDLAISNNRSEMARLLIEKGSAVTSINIAVQIGNLEKVKALLEEGTDINAKNDNGQTPLILAIYNKQAEMGKFLIKNGADVNIADKRGFVPLVYALWNTDPNVVKMLLDNGADVNAKDSALSFSVLHWAIAMDSKEATELVLAAGASVNAKSNSEETPLDVAAYGVSPAIGQLLIANGAEISSLHAASYMGDLAKVKSFIDKGSDVNEKKGMIQITPLHSAAAGGRTEVAEFLISKGADVNAKNRSGQTPLHMAASNGHLDVVKQLLDNNADVTIKDNRGRTAYDWAKLRGHTEIVELLQTAAELDAIPPKESNESRATIDAHQPTYRLFNAVKAGDIEKVRASIADGADINAKDATGRMPVHYAIRNKNKDIIESLLGSAVRPDSYEGRELAKVKTLLSQGMEVNAHPEAGNTLLHYAAQTGYVYVAAYLIVHGADVDVENDAGDTPLDIAMQWKEASTALLLLDAGAKAMENDRRDVLLRAAAGQTARYGENRLRYENNSRMAKSPGRSESQHDIAVSGVSVANTCVQGDIVPIAVTLDNHGDQEEDIVFDPENIGRNIFGQRVCIGGDVNGDGFPEVLIGAWGWQNSRGRAYLHFGGPQISPVADVVFSGTREGDAFANQSGAFGDLNNDGYDDVIIGAIGDAHTEIRDGYVHVYWGGPDMDNVPDIVLKPAEAGRRGGFGFVASGDVDNDGYCDILVGEPWPSGRVSLFWGGDPMSTSTNVVFECAENIWPFSHRMAIGGDVNGDGYNDILIGAR
ncbi:MAG: ankyrin repeat domain-containing protein, partial [Sedimentisphaerales bacterium]